MQRKLVVQRILEGFPLDPNPFLQPLENTESQQLHLFAQGQVPRLKCCLKPLFPVTKEPETWPLFNGIGARFRSPETSDGTTIWQ
jgi:hypothetical protein